MVLCRKGGGEADGVTRGGLSLGRMNGLVVVGGGSICLSVYRLCHYGRVDDDDDGCVVQGTRAWRRRELGWKGAVKKVSGWYSWRGSPGVRFQRPVVVERLMEMEV